MTPLLENPHIRISYLTSTWTTSLQQFLFQHNLQVTLTDILNIQIRGQYDECIMNIDMLTRYTPQQQHNFNLVRLHLQVITEADMALTNLEACPFHIKGQRRPHQVIREKTIGIQQLPPIRHKMETTRRPRSSTISHHRPHRVCNTR